jgi:hypothetical protein
MPPKGANVKWTEYVPHTGMFRTFAGLNITTEKEREWGIRGFASDYGDIIRNPAPEGGENFASAEGQMIL